MASGLLIDYLGSGPIADRPAAPVLFADSLGLWYATDVGSEVLSAWDGSVWADISAGGGGGGSGDVVGPASSVDGYVALFDGITGKLLKQGTGVLGTAAYTAATAYQPVDADLTTIAGLTATTDNFLQAKSSAWASRTPAQVVVDLQGAGLDVDAAGFRGIPQNSQSGNYTTVAADAGKEIYHPSGAGAGDTFTIDSNTNVAYEIGTAITFTNMDSNALSIAITTDTMYLAGTGATGTRTLAQYGTATAVKKTSTTWLVSGIGIT